VGDIDFKVISAAENSNKFQKTRFVANDNYDDFQHVNFIFSQNFILLV
jgi:hypothetical protein